MGPVCIEGQPLVGVSKAGLVEVVLCFISGGFELAEVCPSCIYMDFPCVLCKDFNFGLDDVPLSKAFSAQGVACIKFCKPVRGKLDHLQEVKCSVRERFYGAHLLSARVPLSQHLLGSMVQQVPCRTGGHGFNSHG